MTGLRPSFDVEPTRRELASAFGLPAEMYTSESIYAAEMRAIFARDWIYGCRVDQVAEPGDYWTTEVAGAPLVIVRDKDGTIRAHSSVCRHRGAVVAQGQGNTKAFRCHYHGWTYGLDGKLLAAPLMHKANNFALCDFGLIGVRAEVWLGLVFVNLDLNAPVLTERLAPLSARLEKYRLEEMVCIKSLEFDAPTNWKLYVSNSMEEYHVPVTHAKTLEPSFPMAAHVTEPATGGAYDIKTVNARAFGESPFPRTAGLPDNTTLTSLIYPNFIVSATPTSFSTFIHIPIDVRHTKVKVDMYFPRQTVARQDFAEHSRQYYEGLDVILKEDNIALSSTQRGLASPLYERGRYAFREQVVHSLDNYVLDRLAGLT